MSWLTEVAACRRWLRAQGDVLEFDLGELSRLGALRMALNRQSIDPNSMGSRFLVDHSSRKSGGTEEMFGFKLETVNPYHCFRGLSLRILVFVSLLCRRRLQREIVAVAVAESLRRQLDESFQTYLWNPGNLVAFALAERLPNVHVYVLAPEYPVVRRAVAVHSNPTVLDIQGVASCKRRTVIRRHAFVDDAVKFVFYPTQVVALEREHDEERALLELIECISRATAVPIEVRLHYSDLDRQFSPPLEQKIRHLIPEDGLPSLLALSTKQISFSCQSSIGYELLGLGTTHMILGPKPGGQREQVSTTRLKYWFSTATSVLPWESLPQGWADGLVAAYPERIVRDEEGLLMWGHRVSLC